MRKLFLALSFVAGALSFAGAAHAGTAYTVGDVFVAVSNGQVDEFTPTGTLVQTLNTGLGGFTTGMGFDSSGDLYVTDFSAGDVSEFNNSGTLTNATFISGQVSPESLAFSASGNIYVGDASQAVINEYNAAGTKIGSTNAATQDRGTDWIDLQADQKTMLYTSEGSSVLSVNTATNTQNANFANGLPGSNAYALRTIPTGTDAGDVLVADSSNALLLSSTGTILKTYTLPGNAGGDFALNLDPNGTDFWTADFDTGDVWEVNIATGAIDESWNTGTGGSTVFGLVDYGQITASGGGGGTSATPEPSELSLLAVGLLALGAFAKFRTSKVAV